MDSLQAATPTNGPALLYPVDAHPRSSAPGWDQAVVDAHADMKAARDASIPHAQLVAEAPGDGGSLARAWQWSRHEAASASYAVGEFDSRHRNVLTRAAGVAQAVGGVAEAVTGGVTVAAGATASATGVGAVPGVPAMIGGGALALNGADNAVAGLRTAFTGQFHHTLGSQAAGHAALALGASDRTTDRIINGVDLAQGVTGGAASTATGLLRRGAALGLRAAKAGRVIQEAGDVVRTGARTEAANAGQAASSVPHARAAHAPSAPSTHGPAAHGPAPHGPAAPAPIARTRQALDDLARDPAHNGKVTPGSPGERQVGLALEARGDVPGPIQRDPSGKADFLDGLGTKWDVKSFNSGFPPGKGGFSAARDAGKVDKSLAQGENVMLDTSKMTLADVAALRAEGAARNWGDKVKWWP